MAAKGRLAATDRNELVRVGANIATLADIFDRDIMGVKRVLAKQHIQPNVTDDGKELYPIREVAPFLIDLSAVVDIAEIIKTTSLKKLPPELTKNFWDAANARKKHLEDNGELWRTDAVLEVLVDTFKVLRQSVNQFVDTVSDRTEITDKQRRLIVEMADGLMASMRDKLIDTFELYETVANERDTHDFDDADDE